MLERSNFTQNYAIKICESLTPVGSFSTLQVFYIFLIVFSSKRKTTTKYASHGHLVDLPQLGRHLRRAPPLLRHQMPDSRQGLPFQVDH